MQLDGRGLAARIVQSQPAGSGWTSDHTLAVSVHDLQSNHLFLAPGRTEVLRSSYDWRSAHVHWKNIDYVYLAGSSRGGSFSMRFGAWIMRWPESSIGSRHRKSTAEAVSGVHGRLAGSLAAIR